MKLRIPSSIIALAMLSLSLGACDALTSNATRLARAEQALEAGRLNVAAAEAQAVLDDDAGDANAWLVLARVGIKYGDGEAALRDLAIARRDGAEPAVVRALHEEALLLAGRYQELLDAEIPPEEAATPAHQVAVATALAALGRLDDARQVLDTVLAAHPDHVRGRLAQVRLLHGTGETQAARATLSTLLQNQPDFAPAWMLQGQMELSAADLSAAIEAFRKALPGAAAQLSLPEHNLLLAALADAQLTSGDVPGAASTVQQLRSRVPQWPLTEYLSARLALEQGDAVTAVATLQKALARNPDQPAARVLLGAALMQQGSVEQARSHLTSLLAEEPENLEARRLLARLYMQLGDARAAEQVLTELPAGVAADPISEWMRSAILTGSGQSAEALALLERAARADADNVPLQLDLARAYLSAGRGDDAGKVLAAIPSEKSGLKGRQLTVLHRVLGVSEAEIPQVLLALAAEQPADALLRSVVGETLLQLNHTEAAAEQFRAALAVDGRLVAARLGLADTAQRQGDLATAEQQLLQAVEVEPRNERVYLLLAGIANRGNQPDQTRQWLERAIGAVPGSVDARLALAELSFREQKPDAADALLEQAVSLAGNKPQTLLNAGIIQQRAGRLPQAISAFETAYRQRPDSLIAIRLYEARRDAGQSRSDTILRQWLQDHPEDMAVRITLASHLLGAHDYSGAKTEYERLVQRTPSAEMLNNLAWLYQRTGDARAESTARRAYEAAPENPSIADTYGWILLEKGQAAEALPLLEKAARALPDNESVQSNYRRARQLTEG